MNNAWWQKPLRIVQTNLQVVDTPRIKPKEVIRQLKEDLHANTIVFNAGGIYAWYPTEVPFHFVNPFMEGRDLLGGIVEAAHESDMRVIARVDFSKTDDSTYHQHPEWFVKGPDGQPQAIGEPRYGPWSLLYATCANGPYRNEAVAYPVLREILTKYDVDGFFLNAGSFTDCHCGTCQRKYRKLYGEDLPGDAGQFHPSWRNRCYHDNFGGMYRIIKSIKPDVPWLDHFRLGSDAVQRIQHSDVLCSEPMDILSSGWAQQRPRWWAGMNARFGRTVMENKPPIIIIHSCPGLVWRHTTLPDHESRFWLAQVVANGGSIWHTLTGVPATHYDQRILEGVARFNALAEANEEFLSDLEPITPVAVVDPREAGTEELYGFIEALTNHQIPFSVIPEEYLTSGYLSQYEVLVLPNSSRLSDDAIAAIKQFAERGGGVVASYETSLYDGAGNPRETHALSDILGIRYEGHRLRDLVASYMRIEQADHPLVAGIGNTELIYNEMDLLQVSTDADVPLTLVPPFGVSGAVGKPPERASLPTKQTEIPVVVSRDRRLYFAGEIGRLVWRYRMPDHQDLIANAVKAVASHPMPLEIDGPHSLQVALYRQGKRRLLHLVNATGSRPLQDTIPLKGVTIRLRLENPASKIRTLVNSDELESEQSGDIVKVTVPNIDAWEIVCFETD